MTKTQKRVIDEIERNIPKFDFYNRPDEFEIKKWEVVELQHGTVSLYIVTGLKNDEGTLAACLCRKRRHLFIGVKGGVKNTKNSKRGIFNALNSGYSS